MVELSKSSQFAEIRREQADSKLMDSPPAPPPHLADIREGAHEELSSRSSASSSSSSGGRKQAPGGKDNCGEKQQEQEQVLRRSHEPTKLGGGRRPLVGKLRNFVHVVMAARKKGEFGDKKIAACRRLSAPNDSGEPKHFLLFLLFALMFAFAFGSCLTQADSALLARSSRRQDRASR